MRKVGLFEAKQKLSELVERAGRGEAIGITKRGKLAAVIGPAPGRDQLDKTDLDEQEGMMHLFEGAVLAIRNPGGHSFPEALSNAQSNILLC
jgi:prevent-host-death family protein